MNGVSKYFNGEKFQCTIGIALALLSIAIALYFLFQVKRPFYTGISYPFMVIPVLLLMICVGVVIRSPKDIGRVNAMIQTDKTKVKTEELPRMETVMRNFRVIKWTEISFIVAGFLLFFLMPSGSLWKGVGVGLAIQAAMVLVFDIVAESRGKVYLEFLNNLN